MGATRRALTVGLLIGALGLGGLPAPTPAYAATFAVDTTADLDDANVADGVCAASNGRCSLRAAVQQANQLGGSHTIRLPAGTFAFTQAGADDDAAAGDLDVSADITVAGASPAATRIDARQLDRVFDVVGGRLALSNLTIRGGQTGGDGGGLRVIAGRLGLNNVAVTGNAAASFGGGILIATGAEATVTNSQIAENRADSAGGIGRIDTGTLTVTNTTIRGNRATGSGGGVILFGADASATFSNTPIVDNSAAGDGGGLLLFGATATVTGGRIADNRAGSDGGGVFSQSGTLTLRNAPVTGNRADADGGGLSLGLGGTLELTNSPVRLNRAADGGGIIFGGPPINPLTATFANSPVSLNQPNNCVNVPGC